MKVKIFGENEGAIELLSRVGLALEELGLNDFIEIEKTNNPSLKTELKITSEPALIIEEESIDFRDTIFEGIVPELDELKSMFISIIGGEGGCSSEGGSCGSGGCSSCH